MPDSTKAERLRDDGDSRIVLGVLNAVEQNSRLTQRTVAHDLGIALGLANAYLKRCVRKGLIKIAQVPANRYAYYLTPKGFSEKSHLTVRYLSTSFEFFRGARSQCGDLLAGLAARNIRQVALAGAGDLAEIATLCARDYPIELSAILDDAHAAPRFAGLPVVKDMAAIAGVDAVVITDLKAPQATYDRAVAALGAGRVFAPRLLNITPVTPASRDAP
jgi:DNA-binding MarR family transcriptional regulator